MPLDPATPEVIEALRAALPEGVVSEVPDAYREEPRGRYHSTAAALVRPADTDEVAAAVRFAADRRIGIVPYAGGTGLVGGQTPEGRPTILLSVERLNRIAEIDADGNVAVVGAGVVLADLHAAADRAGRLFPLSLGSQGSARVGGLLATNAGGTAVLRYGNMRDLCLGVEAVLADGSVLRGLRQLRKDNTGYDLRHLLIGSEGTLGIITAACLRLFPQPAERATALLAVASPSAARAVFGHLSERLGETLSGFEIMSGQGIRFVAETMPEVERPFDPPPDWSLLVEASGGAGSDIAARMESALAAALEDELITDALLAQNEGQAAAFWHLREIIPEANRKWGAVASHDVSVPVGRMPEFIDAAAAAVAEIDDRLLVNSFGHMGDGNLHLNVFPPERGGRAAFDDVRGAVMTAVHDTVHRFDGSISAEHGIGRLKTGDLNRYGDPAKLAAMRAIKAALDPSGILNPGVLLPADED